MNEETQTQGVTDGQDTAQPGTTPPADAQPQDEQVSEPSDAGAGEGEEATTTDRGTKVAKEPDSQFYQQLKNENGDMRRLLGDPKALKEYLRELEGTQAPAQGEADDFADLAEKVLDQNGQVDIKKLAGYLDNRLMQKLDQAVKFSVNNQVRSAEVERTYHSDLGSIRTEHPELNPNNKDAYDPDLDQLVGERFIAQGGMEGKVTLKQVVDKTYAYLKRGQDKGRQQAETQIIRKQAGAIPQPKVPGNSTQADEEKSPEQLLAERVRKQVTRR